MNTLRARSIRRHGGAVGLVLALSAPARPASAASWVPTGSSATSHGNGATATLLRNGQVLVAGGLGTAVVELYHPQSGTWTLTGSLSVPRSAHTATRLRDGRVLVAGGFDQQPCYPGCPVPVHATAEIYDPETGAWSATGSMSVPRSLHTATLLRDGRVLVAGGSGEIDVLASAETFDPHTGAWSAAAAWRENASGTP